MNLKIISFLLVIILLAVAYRVGYPYYRQHQVDALYNQAESTYQQEKYDEALAKYVKLTDKYLHYLSPLKQANIYIAMANCYYDKDKFTDGVDCFAKAAEIVKKHNLLSEIEAPTLFYSRWGIGLENKRKYSRAEQVYQEGIKQIRKVYGPEYRGIILLSLRLGNVYNILGYYKKSLIYWEVVLENKEYISEQNDLGKSMIYRGSTIAYCHNNCLDKSAVMWKKSFFYTQKYYGEGSVKVGLEYAGIALVYYKQKKILQAIKSLNKCYSIFKEKCGEAHSATQRIAKLREKWKKENEQDNAHLGRP